MRLQLERHLVELLAQLGELVVALRRDLDGEVALPQAPGRAQEPLHLVAQRPVDDQGEDQRHGQERECQADDDERAAVGAPGPGRSAGPP